MAGKGSKPRPLSVKQNDFDAQWDLIFGGKNMKHTNPQKISVHFSENGRKEAVVLKTIDGFVVDLYEQSRYIKTVNCTDHSLQYAEDCAENYTLGVFTPE